MRQVGACQKCENLSMMAGYTLCWVHCVTGAWLRQTIEWSRDSYVGKRDGQRAARSWQHCCGERTWFFFAKDVNPDVTRNDSTRVKHAWLTLNKSTFQLHVPSTSRLATVQSHANAHSVSQKQLCPTHRVPQHAHGRVSSPSHC